MLSRERLILGLYVVAFAAATLFHVATLVRCGRLPYRVAPLPRNVF